MAVGVALFLVVGAVWFLTTDARHWSDRPFDSCSVRDGNLILRHGELRLDRFNTGDVVMQHDGSRLTCARAVERPVS